MLVITVHSLNIKKPCCLDLNCYYFAIVATLISSMINKDLRLIYLYEFKRGTNATETARNINEAFGDKSAEVRTVQRWFARFRNGDESCMVKQYHGRKRKFDDVRLRTVVEADPGTTVRRLAKRPFLTQDLTTFIKKASMTLSHVGTNVFNLMELTLIKYIFIT